jgi:hypothetical protein
MRLIAFVPLVFAAACAQIMLPDGAPDEVSLSGQILTVRMSNGSKCTVDLTRKDWTKGAPTITGEMPGCGGGLTYNIRPEGPSHVQKTVGGGLGNYFAPYARVQLISGKGQSWTYDFPTGGGR